MKGIDSRHVIDVAETYLKNNEKLIYSYHGNVFLQGGELYDAENSGRGRIDCSTLVHLALLGITYENSPYATGNTEDFFKAECTWYDPGAHPAMRDIFAGRADRASDIRRAYGLAKYFFEKGMTLGEEDAAKPGDLVFFEAGASVIEEYRKYGAWRAISHVGIVAEDTEYMINATGSSIHELNATSFPIHFTKISKKGEPVLRVRI